jgi:hypothetical protein
MFVPCITTTRPLASVIQRPAWDRGRAGLGAGVAAADPGITQQTTAAHSERRRIVAFTPATLSVCR